MGIIKRVYNAIKTGGGNPQSLSYWVRKMFGSGTVTMTGLDIDEDSALTLSGIWAATSIISGAIGCLPTLTYKTQGDQKQRAADHPVYKLLKTRPNPYMDAVTFKETLQSHCLLWGNGYAEIERSAGGIPVSLWPLLPNHVEPKFIDRELKYFIKNSEGPDQVLDSSQVLHIKGLGFDGIKGYSVVQYACENLALGLAAEKNAAAFFGNDSSPSGILTTPDVLKKADKDAIEKAWEEKHRGLDSRYRIAILHSGLNWQQIGISAKDSQLIESRKFSINDVARWFSIPPHMLAELDRATFSNIEEQGIDFVRWTLNKWFEKWTQELDFKLFKANSGYFTEFLPDALLRGNTESRYKAYQIALGGNNNPGFMKVNEVRAKENMPADPDGDKLFMPNYNNTDTSALLNSAWQRISNKEIKAVYKAIKKPDQFLDWCEDFYAKHMDFAVSVLEPILKVQKEGDAKQIAQVYVDCHKSKLIEAFKAGNVIEQLNTWEGAYEQD